MRHKLDKAIVLYFKNDVVVQEKIDGIVALRLIDWPTPTYYFGGKPYFETNERAKRLFLAFKEKHDVSIMEISKDVWIEEKLFSDPHKHRQPTEASDPIIEVRDRTKIEENDK